MQTLVVSEVMAESALENAAATMLMQKGMTKKNPSAPDETSMGSRASPDDGGCMPRAAQSV